MTFPQTAAKILAVDDEPDFELLLTQRFRRQIREGEFTFRFAGDGEEALAALTPLLRPTEGMIGAAHEAVWFDAFWAINSRADFRKAVRAMIKAAREDGGGKASGRRSG